MPRFIAAYFTLLLLLFLGGCTQAPPPTSTDTRAADQKAISDLEAAWNANCKSKDLEKIVSIYADDANFMDPNVPTVKGKEAIRAYFKPILDDKNFALVAAPATVEVAKGGDLAYTQGTYTLTMTDAKTRKPVTEKGKYVMVYKKQPDGSWKAIQDIGNADAPAK
jgi:uncharacterized protein (TIGR02246 family)